MPNYNTATPEKYDVEIPMLNPTDPNSNTVFNDVLQKIINNQSYLYHKVGILENENTQLKAKIQEIGNRSPRQQLAALGTMKTIEVAGSSETYYPVAVQINNINNCRGTLFGLGKELGTKTAAYTGNHSNGTTSLSYEWYMRNNGWDGNINFIKTIHGSWSYARTLAHIEAPNGSFRSFVLWLRGGGTQYTLICDDPFTCNIYYQRANLTAYPDGNAYAYFVEPKASLNSSCNYGILEQIDGTV